MSNSIIDAQIDNPRWVKCKNNNNYRYITRITNTMCFEDDGTISGLHPSPFCHFEHYLVNTEFIKFILKQETR